MTQRIRDSLRASYDAFASKGELTPLIDSLADDIRWHVSGRSPLAGHYRGKAEVLALFARMMELYRGTLRLQVLDILASEAHAIVLTQEWAEYAGKKFEWHGVHLWTIGAGQFTQFEVYNDDAYHALWAD